MGAVEFAGLMLNHGASMWSAMRPVPVPTPAPIAHSTRSVSRCVSLGLRLRTPGSLTMRAGLVIDYHVRVL